MTLEQLKRQRRGKRYERQVLESETDGGGLQSEGAPQGGKFHRIRAKRLIDGVAERVCLKSPIQGGLED